MDLLTAQTVGYTLRKLDRKYGKDHVSNVWAASEQNAQDLGYDVNDVDNFSTIVLRMTIDQLEAGE